MRIDHYNQIFDMALSEARIYLGEHGPRCDDIALHDAVFANVLDYIDDQGGPLSDYGAADISEVCGDAERHAANTYV